MSDTSNTPKKAQRLIEIVIGPCSRYYSDGIAIELQALMDERWPELGAAVAVKYEVEQVTKQDEAEDHAAALINVAAWFARWIVADELGAHDGPDDADPMEIAKLPEPFRQLVAAQMVINEFLGWPDVDEALITLGELYGWGPE